MYSIVSFEVVCIYRNLSISLNEVFEVHVLNPQTDVYLKSSFILILLRWTFSQQGKYINQMVLHKYIKLLKLKQ